MKQKNLENLENLEKLETLAAADPIFRDYEQTLAELEGAFRRLVRLLPGKTGRRIEAYVEYQRLKYQRLLWLACEHMEFHDET